MTPPAACPFCHGESRVRNRRGNTVPCKKCQGVGLLSSDRILDPSTLRVAIVGGGIGGWALAVCLQQRNVACTLFEKDASIHDRSQGYGLTLQQASPKSLGIQLDGIVSTKHLVHTPDGNVLGQWGARHWQPTKESKKTNIHISRQALRQALVETALQYEPTVCWNHKLVDIEGNTLKFQVKDESVTHTADLIVGADGIWSRVRQAVLPSNDLRYLGCYVMLGIGDNIEHHELMDGETVFQTADGTTRLYVMPYSSTQFMWQLSFPWNETDVIEDKKAEAQRRCGDWHDPIPRLLEATDPNLITGYPVYDRPILQEEQLDPSRAHRSVTLLGDAAHPMSPFKGQGANQAILDALLLARCIVSETRQWQRAKNTSKSDLVARILQAYEPEMMRRSRPKVEASATAAEFLHSPVAIQPGDMTRGAANAMCNS